MEGFSQTPTSNSTVIYTDKNCSNHSLTNTLPSSSLTQIKPPSPSSNVNALFNRMFPEDQALSFFQADTPDSNLIDQEFEELFCEVN